LVEHTIEDVFNVSNSVKHPSVIILSSSTSLNGTDIAPFLHSLTDASKTFTWWRKVTNVPQCYSGIDDTRQERTMMLRIYLQNIVLTITVWTVTHLSDN